MAVTEGGSRSTPWLFSRRLDLLAFGAPALLAFALLALGAARGWLTRPFPTWAWVLLVVGVDVAHVWTTLFRVYLDRDEVAAHRTRYLGIPVLVYVAGVALYARAPALFWRVLAYTAVWHFVRQQAGWIALYRRRGGETSRFDAALDTTVIYAATLFPLVWWHAHLPRSFVWFVPGDFVPGVSRTLATVLHPVHLALAVVWAARQIVLARRTHRPPLGKDLVIVTTWASWYVGIVVLDSDFAFTVTNVLLHGVPYAVLLWVYGRRRYAATPGRLAGWIVAHGVIAFVGFVWLLAWLEEAAWDQAVWHDHPDLFGDVRLALTSPWLIAIVPLLAVPQATHYVLDGLIWRGRTGNATLGSLFPSPSAPHGTGSPS